MSKFKLEDYDPVEERIKKFYADHPDGRIETVLASDPNNIDFATFRAAVYIDGVVKATGWAVEMRDKELSKSKTGYEYESVNYTSWLENCETSAIGRALANAGYQGSKRPSREEMQKVERMSSSPKDPKEGWDEALNLLKVVLDQAVVDTVITAEDRGKTLDKVDTFFTTADLDGYRQAVIKHLDKKRAEGGLF